MKNLNQLFEEVLNETTWRERADEADFESEFERAYDFCLNNGANETGTISKKLLMDYLKNTACLSRNKSYCIRDAIESHFELI